MWLLNTTSYTLHLKQDPAEVTTYAILSHVWDQHGEQTFQVGVADDHDQQLLALVRERLSPKIRSLCDFARSQGFKYAWIDTCCIDKSSSAELSEAITSMFDWYSLAAVCYVFLADVPETEDPAARWSQFRGSMWFQRGWTLQELIVPQRNVFLSKNWRLIGTKKSLSKVIETITGIDEDILVHRRPLHTVSVARRMSWAQFRQTTRVEDEAYCLMGIFGVRIPAIYGEGRHAFVRLQEEIMKSIPDQSLFAWG
ncbi:HET-domain-containing protein, partial [Cubamyces sp. BRFM 1775]